MDLLEARGSNRRHPWELSRARAVEHIVRTYGRSTVASILDWGCGDGFTGRFLLQRLRASSLVGVDPHLSDAQRSSLANQDDRIRLFRDELELPTQQFDLVLLCDVIEHVPDDIALLQPLVQNYLSQSGRLIVTVPAFQALFSAHDVALKHFRRYHLEGLETVLRQAGLQVLGSGYLFGSLLPPRAVSKLFERKRPASSDEEIGIGAWTGGKAVSALLESLLSFDNAVLLELAEHGVKAPGLSAWAACVRES